MRKALTTLTFTLAFGLTGCGDAPAKGPESRPAKPQANTQPATQAPSKTPNVPAPEAATVKSEADKAC